MAPEDVVKELTAGGMTQVSAQRFVDRAVLEHQSAPPLPPVAEAPAPPADALDQFIQTKTAESAAAEARTGRRPLWVASALMCSGIAITGISFMMAGEGDRFTLMWGPVAFGFFLWAKTVIQGFGSVRTFAWFSAIGSLLAPIVLTIVLLVAIVATAPPLEDEVEAAQSAPATETASR